MDRRWQAGSIRVLACAVLATTALACICSPRPPRSSAGSGDYYPEWSPDGQQIVYMAVRGGEQTIRVLDVNSGQDGSDDSTYLTEGGDPTWSPDGLQIAFHHHGDLYRIDADGSNRVRLTRDSGRNESPAWSPDGRYIAFVSGRDHQDSENTYEVFDSEVYVMKPDGSDTTRLTVRQAKIRSPAWSPDGERIAYYSADGPNEAVVHILNVADGLADPENVSVDLTDASAYEIDPAWSPDGQWVAFSSNREGLADGNVNHGAIYLVAANGGELKRLTTSAVWASQPAWSPDGEWLAFSVKSDDDFGDIYVMRLDGSELRCLTCGPVQSVDAEP